MPKLLTTTTSSHTYVIQGKNFLFRITTTHKNFYTLQGSGAEEWKYKQRVLTVAVYQLFYVRAEVVNETFVKLILFSIT